MRQQILEAEVKELTEALNHMAQDRDRWVVRFHKAKAKLKRYEAENDALLDQRLPEPDDRGDRLGTQDDGGRP